MKIRPAKGRGEPKYPTRRQALENPELLKSAPARWEKVPGMAALLGALALCAARPDAAAGEETPAAAAMDAAAEKGERAGEKEIRKAGAAVAPILEEALAGDGRGSFGCIAVSPPSFLSEDEALELIREELEAAGLKLRDDAVLEGVPGPTGNRVDAQIVAKESEVSLITYQEALDGEPVLGPRKVRFDWADPERGVYVEYLARRDHRDWKGMDGSTVDFYDFADLAQKVSAAYGKYEAGRRTTFGVLFDPLAHPGVEDPPVDDLTPEQRRLAEKEGKRASEEAGNARAKEKLRRQARYFVEYLRGEGILPRAE